MLQKLADGLWADARRFRAGPFLEIGTRMSVVRLADGGLFLHSLVEIDDETRAALEELGPVHHLVAGNQLHHLYLASAAKAFPQAELWVRRASRRSSRTCASRACSATRRRRPGGPTSTSSPCAASRA